MSIWSSRATMQTTVLAATRVGRGGEQRPVAVAQRPWAGGRSAGDKRMLRGACLCREPLQYRHIASGSPPRPASHIASVAHVPIYEIGSGPTGRDQWNDRFNGYARRREFASKPTARSFEAPCIQGGRGCPR